MIKGNAIIECGMGTTHSVSAVHSETGMGVVGMRTGTPVPIGENTEMNHEEFEEFMAGAEVLIYFRNIESIDSVINTFTGLREMMAEERERLDKEENDE